MTPPASARSPARRRGGRRASLCCGVARSLAKDMLNQFLRQLCKSRSFIFMENSFSCAKATSASGAPLKHAVSSFPQALLWEPAQGGLTSKSCTWSGCCGRAPGPTRGLRGFQHVGPKQRHRALLAEMLGSAGQSADLLRTDVQNLSHQGWRSGSSRLPCSRQMLPLLSHPTVQRIASELWTRAWKLYAMQLRLPDLIRP